MSQWDFSRCLGQRCFKEKNELGDCWRCCVAAILRLPRNRVPHFLKQSKRSHKHNMKTLTQEWLNQRGWMLIECSPSFPRRWTEDRIMVPRIACGPTPRSKQMGEHHAVVMIEDQVVFDPHPSKAGLTAITDQFLVVPIPHYSHMK